MKNFRYSEKLEEFNNKIEGIVATNQDKFVDEIKSLAYDNVQKFRSLLARELDSIFKKIHSQNIDLLKSSLVDYATKSNSISKKGETALVRSLLSAVEHTIKNLLS